MTPRFLTCVVLSGKRRPEENILPAAEVKLEEIVGHPSVYVFDTFSQ